MLDPSLLDNEHVGSTKYTVCQMLGTGYSGSSILNLMLDSIHGIRGLGEVHRIYHAADLRPCSLCQSSYDDETLNECGFYDGFTRDTFYRECFRKYPDARVLVDASKIGIDYPRIEEVIQYRTLYLLKWPHEFVAGSAFKDNALSIQDRFEQWLRVNEGEIQISAGSLVVPYRSFALQPDAVLRSICDFLQVPFVKRDDWWNTTTHIIGGNWSARAQMNRQYARYLEETEKYKGHFHEIFLDEAWRMMPEICDESIRLYEHFHERCDAIFRALKMPSVKAMMADIEGTRIGSLPCVTLR